MKSDECHGAQYDEAGIQQVGQHNPPQEERNKGVIGWGI
jgi:hypothetical protein